MVKKIISAAIFLVIFTFTINAQDLCSKIDLKEKEKEKEKVCSLIKETQVKLNTWNDEELNSIFLYLSEVFIVNDKNEDRRNTKAYNKYDNKAYTKYNQNGSQLAINLAIKHTGEMFSSNLLHELTHVRDIIELWKNRSWMYVGTSEVNAYRVSAKVDRYEKNNSKVWNNRWLTLDEQEIEAKIDEAIHKQLMSVSLYRDFLSNPEKYKIDFRIL